MADKTVNDPSPIYEEMELDREFPRILLYNGQRGVRDGGETYLPKYEGEEGSATATTSEYGARLSRSFLVNFYKDAVQNLVGRIFAEPLVFSEDTPQAILELWENIDDCGTSGDIFVQRVAVDALGQGVSHVLVDYQGSGNFANAAEEARAGLRPKWIHYKAQDVIEALGRIINGRPYLERARIRERMLSAENYEYATSDRVREYVMGDIWADISPGSPFFSSWRIHEETEDGDWVAGEWYRIEPPSRADRKQRAMFVEPPLVPFYGEHTGFFEGKPALLTVADLNLQHYRLKSNIDNMEFTATVPTLLLKGGQGDTSQVEVGAGRIIGIPDDHDLSWLEIQGNGVTHAKDSLRHLEEHIRLAGREPMVKKATGSELATVRMLDEAQHLNTAQSIALKWVADIQRCIDWTAAWMGIPNAGTVRIDESVMEALSRPEGFDDVKELAALGFLSQREVLKEAKRYGVLDREFDVDLAVEESEADEPLALSSPEPIVEPVEEVM